MEQNSSINPFLTILSAAAVVTLIALSEIFEEEGVQ